MYSFIIKRSGGKLKPLIEDELPQAPHFSVTTLTDDMLAVQSGEETPGIKIVFPGGRIVRLPEDGEEFYAMNAAGKTVMCKRWPIKKGDA